MYLLDTNIFLEILLRQSKDSACRSFLESNSGKIFVSDFSVYSIGVILLRVKKAEVFLNFLDALLPSCEILRLSIDELRQVHSVSTATGLDFDDSLQLVLAHIYELTLVTLDRHFVQVEQMQSPPAPIMFL